MYLHVWQIYIYMIVHAHTHAPRIKLITIRL